MKVYVVDEYINDWAENGGGCQGTHMVFANEQDAIDYCKPLCLFEDETVAQGEAYYEYYEMEVQ